MKRFLGSLVIALLIAYFATSFVQWEFYPGLWSDKARAVAAFVSLVIFFAAIIYPGWDD